MEYHMQDNITQLNRYLRQNFRQICNSQFVVKNICEVPHIDGFILSGEAKKVKVAHYLFMYLLTRDMRVHLIKYNVPTKYKKQVHRIKKNSKLIARLSPKATEYVLHILLFEVFAQLFASEKIIFKINKHIVKLIIDNVPLMQESLILQSTSGYLTNIPLVLNFNIPYTTFYQKFFFCRAIKLYAYTLKNNFDSKELDIGNNSF